MLYSTWQTISYFVLLTFWLYLSLADKLCSKLTVVPTHDFDNGCEKCVKLMLMVFDCFIRLVFLPVGSMIATYLGIGCCSGIAILSRGVKKFVRVVYADCWHRESVRCVKSWLQAVVCYALLLPAGRRRLMFLADRYFRASIRTHSFMHSK